MWAQHQTFKRLKYFRKHIKYLFLLIFPAVCILFYNTAINIHSHQLGGNIITHAHPFTKNSETSPPFQNHQHTTVELFLLSKVFYLFATIIICIAAFKILLSFQNKTRLIIPVSPIRESFPSFDKSRAPPYFSNF